MAIIRNYKTKNFSVTINSQMKDLWNGRQIVQENDFERNEIKTDDPVVNYELGKIQETGIKVNLENGDIKETLAWLNEVNIALEMLGEKPEPIQLMEGDFKNKKPLDSIPKIYNGYIGQRGDSVQTDRQYEDNLSGEKSQDALNDLKELSEKISLNGKMNPTEFLGELQKITHIDEQKSHCIRHYIDNEQYNLRISNHSANAVHAKLRPNETSVVIKLSSPKFHKDKESYLVEYVYESKDLTSEKQLGIINGLRDWIQTGEYTDKGYNKDYYSPSEELWKIAKGIQQHSEPVIDFNEDGYPSAEDIDRYMEFRETLAESERAINEATNGMGHDPTDGLPLDFDSEEENSIVYDGLEETNESLDMYETKDGKLFYPEEIVPFSAQESLTNVYQENDVDTTDKKVDAYASEIHSILSEFSTANSADWNVDNETAVTLHHLSSVADIKNLEREESIEKIKEYFTTDEYANEKEQIGKTFSEIIDTKNENGYGFEFALKRGDIKSILGNEFSGGNIKLTKQFQDECIKNGLANPKDEFIIVSENEAKAMGTKIRQNSPSVTLTIPVKTGNETNFVATKYYHVSALEEIEKLQKYQNENQQENVQENTDEQKTVSQLNSSIVFGKTELPPFALITKEGLQKFDKCVVESFDNKSHKYIVKTENGSLVKLNGTTLESIVNPEKFNERMEKQKIESIRKQSAIIEGKTKVPEFAMITQHGLQTFKDMTVEKYNAESKSWTLSNADGQSVNVTDLTLKELTSNQRIKQAQNFTDDTLARDKMLVTQYNDYFKQRDNTAYNFRHNLSVYCRKEANSPVDALKIAGIIIKEMPVEERRKTKDLLNTMRRDGETVNQVIANMYAEAVKEVPLNENYIANNHHNEKIARPMYDTLSVKGEKIDRDFNLKIGDNISNMAFRMGKTFGIGKETLYQSCTIVSASKEGNVVTLMDGNKSYYDVPRDTFLKEYAKQQKHEQKLENHQQRQHRRNMQMSVDY